MKRFLSSAMQSAVQTIGTHNGTFHCDEALACFFLKCLPKYANAKIIRSRNAEELAKCNIVVDVGAVYDPEKFRFDHHQRSFDLSLNSIVPELTFETRLSSAGLIYAHYGKEVIRELIRSELPKGDVDPDEHLINILYKKCYVEFVEEIDAVDNGIDQYPDAQKPKYLITTTVSSRVAGLNPPWNDKSQNENDMFEKAMALVGREFVDRLTYFFKIWWPARSLVAKAFERRHTICPSGSILMLEMPCPWKEHLFEIELDNDSVGQIKYCFFFDERQSYWMIVCVPIEIKSFQNRLPLFEKWRGLRDDDLCQTSNIDGCVFVHASGFCGANRTKEGALEMMRISMQSQSKPE